MCRTNRCCQLQRVGSAVSNKTLVKHAADSDTTQAVGLYERLHFFEKPWFQTWYLLTAQAAMAVVCIVLQAVRGCRGNGAHPLNGAFGGQWSNLAAALPLALVTVMSTYVEAYALIIGAPLNAGAVCMDGFLQGGDARRCVVTCMLSHTAPCSHTARPTSEWPPPARH